MGQCGPPLKLVNVPPTELEEPMVECNGSSGPRSLDLRVTLTLARSDYH